MFGSTKIAINRSLAQIAYGDGNLPNSWDLVFNLNTVKKLAKCGIGFMDEPIEIISTLLNYMGVTIEFASENNINKASDLLTQIKPYIKTINPKYRDEFNAGNLCVVITRTPILGEQLMPDEGVFMTIETAVIGAKSNNIEPAHKFIDFFMRPEIMAQNLAFTNFPVANNKIKTLVAAELANNPNLFPTKKEISLAQLLPNLPSKHLFKVRSEFDKFKKQ